MYRYLIMHLRRQRNSNMAAVLLHLVMHTVEHLGDLVKCPHFKGKIKKSYLGT